MFISRTASSFFSLLSNPPSRTGIPGARRTFVPLDYFSPQIYLSRYHGSCIPAYAHHARHYFWGTFPVRFLHRSALGLERAQLASGPFFLRTRAPELDADSRAGYPWTLFPITPGKVRHSLSCCRRCGFLLYHFQLSVLAWAGLLRKSLLHLIDSGLYFWPDAFVSEVRATL